MPPLAAGSVPDLNPTTFLSCCRCLQHERFSRFNRNAIAERDERIRCRRNARAGQNDADEIQRIARRNFQFLRCAAAALRASQRAKRFHSLRQRELLADKPVHETASADLATKLHATVLNEQIAPRRVERLSSKQFAEHHAIALQQSFCDLFRWWSRVVMKMQQ